ncbi:uncharacterized protein [Ptychodera flava]|uniref:uncharacterized protein isoform X1 n=1 Tax=Ptychodera flava TaxID=63121 RepID=UPI00396A5795
MSTTRETSQHSSNTTQTTEAERLTKSGTTDISYLPSERLSPALKEILRFPNQSIKGRKKRKICDMPNFLTGPVSMKIMEERERKKAREFMEKQERMRKREEKKKQKEEEKLLKKKRREEREKGIQEKRALKAQQRHIRETNRNAKLKNKSKARRRLMQETVDDNTCKLCLQETFPEDQSTWVLCEKNAGGCGAWMHVTCVPVTHDVSSAMSQAEVPFVCHECARYHAFQIKPPVKKILLNVTKEYGNRFDDNAMLVHIPKSIPEEYHHITTNKKKQQQLITIAGLPVGRVPLGMSSTFRHIIDNKNCTKISCMPTAEPCQSFKPWPSPFDEKGAGAVIPCDYTFCITGDPSPVLSSLATCISTMNEKSVMKILLDEQTIYKW